MGSDKSRDSLHIHFCVVLVVCLSFCFSTFFWTDFMDRANILERFFREKFSDFWNYLKRALLHSTNGKPLVAFSRTLSAQDLN